MSICGGRYTTISWSSAAVIEYVSIRAERQSARISKITSDGLIRSGTGCFTAVPIMATVGLKGLRKDLSFVFHSFRQEERRSEVSLTRARQCCCLSVPGSVERPRRQ